jgi:phosphoenolpyruvate-protein phosphotransferase
MLGAVSSLPDSPVILAAPLAGWLCTLDEVPDEVFADRIMGEGLAIDPLEGELRAPCDGTVIQVAPTGHALTIRCANGAEILLHIGLETVALGGQGFVSHVSAGQSMRQGERLISFDLDSVALEAKSLVSPIVLTNPEAFEFVPSGEPRRVVAGEAIARLSPIGAEQPAPTEAEGATAAIEMVMTLAHGLHARPAARIAAVAKGHPAELKLRAHGREANARSPVSLMTLGLSLGDPFQIAAQGPDAQGAALALAEFIRGLTEDSAPAPPAPQPVEATLAEARGPQALSGVCAVPGLAMGPACHWRVQDPQVAEKGAGIEAERSALARALAELRVSLMRGMEGTGETAQGIAEAHLALLGDEDLLAAARQGIADGKSAGAAWRAAIREVAERLRSTGNPLLLERIDDMLDLERQVILALNGSAALADFAMPEGAIVLAETLLPSDWMALDKQRLAGLCLAGGGPTSHVAIMAAAAGVPTLVAAGPRVAGIAEGATLLLDATAGRLIVDPDPALRASASAAIGEARQRAEAEQAEAHEPATTLDGQRIHVLANLGSAAEAAAAVAAGAEGCGLLRTEFLFLDRELPPPEDEQLAAYQAVADALGERPLILRSLDVGGDKPLAYLPIPPEDNPALGLRGVRASLWKPDLLDEQLRAVLRVEPPGRCRIMVPMVVSAEELSAVRARLDAAATATGGAPVELGVMIETPAAALLVDQLAAQADFFSIGSNDLAQYVLAMDRGNPLVAAEADAFHPAVLRLIAGTVRAAGERERPVGVCGGLASDPLGALLLIGLGVTEISVAPAMVAAIKARIRTLSLDRCRELATRAMDEISPQAVRRLLAGALDRPTPDAGSQR